MKQNLGQTLVLEYAGEYISLHIKPNYAQDRAAAKILRENPNFNGATEVYRRIQPGAPNLVTITVPYNISVTGRDLQSRDLKEGCEKIIEKAQEISDLTIRVPRKTVQEFEGYLNNRL